MTRPVPLRFLRTDSTMAYPSGRLLAVRSGQFQVLATDGWIRLGGGRPAGSVWLSREEARQWCVEAGFDAGQLDAVPEEG